MFGPVSGLQQTTNFKVVLPFYAYAAISFLIASTLLLWHVDVVQQHYFQPQILAITHIMALGWGTMIIMGASHQLLPVLIEGKLDDIKLAKMAFYFCAIGIPLLAYGFYTFHLGWISQTGAALVNIGVLCYVMNVINSIRASKKHEIHAWFIGAAAIWLFSTTFVGLLLVFNFTKPLLPSDSVSYLSLHAHLGIIGWFLMLVLGVASRLIPLFLISKYTNDKKLWFVFTLINLSLISFIVLRLMELNVLSYYLPLALSLIGVGLFVDFCRRAYKVRLRKAVDEQMKISLLSVLQMTIPVIVLIVIILILPTGENTHLSMLYGFCIFFGWLTAIILGMTFKTLPFIVWNKVYQAKSNKGKVPLPKELFSEKIFHYMLIAYLLGFITFIIGLLINSKIILTLGAVFLLITALLYVINTAKTFFHKANIE